MVFEQHLLLQRVNKLDLINCFLILNRLLIEAALLGASLGGE